jgi:hypothetical protein
MTGSNLFNNPLLTSSNTLNGLFQPIISTSGTFTIPDGTTVSLWNPNTSSFDTTATFTNGSWSADLKLPPGTGALVFAPRPFTNTIIGEALDHNGIPMMNNVPIPPPTLFSGPDGIYLLGDKAPFIDTGTNIFLNIIGRIPYVGEKVMLLSGTSTYLGNGTWDSIPAIGLGQAAFLTIMSEPPPALTIVSSNSQTIVAWPPSASPWTLQTNSDLANGTWGDYAGLIINNTVTNPAAAGNLFFRLSYP